MWILMQMDILTQLVRELIATIMIPMYILANWKFVMVKTTIDTPKRTGILRRSRLNKYCISYPLVHAIGNHPCKAFSRKSYLRGLDMKSV